MPTQPARFSHLRAVQVLVCVVAVVFGALLIGLGLLDYGTAPEIGTKVWLVAAGAFIVVFAIIVLTIAPLLLKIESTTARQLSELRDLNETLPSLVAKLNDISENTRISDAAKSLAHREEELEALRRGIREEIRSERWEAAFSLVDEIHERFSYKQEADRLREELVAARDDAVEKKLAEAVELIETHFRAQEWDSAANEIERLAHALPNDMRVANLAARLDSLRTRHKAGLRKEWDRAVERGETDHAIDVLKQLDPHLSPDEVKELANAARTVFKEKLLQIGIQFRFAVKEKRWDDALKIGMEIVRDYPNARMAQEVHEMLDVLRERAQGSPDTTIAPQEPQH